MRPDGYSSALMGFDFADADTLDLARYEFAKYLTQAGVEWTQADEQAHKLNRSWEFAIYHLPGQHDQCDHSPTGECAPVETGGKASRIETVKGRAFTGQPRALRNAIGKQETGKIGEALALRLTGAKRMNGKWNNFPIDLVKGGTVYEVKAGLASNRVDAQKWRLTIGEPGPREKAWLRKASESAKARWNERKNQMIIERKKKVVAELSRKLGRKVTAKTVTFIIDPDRKTADMYEFDGFHPVIRWRSPQAAKAYRRTVKYG